MNDVDTDTSFASQESDLPMTKSLVFAIALTHVLLSNSAAAGTQFHKCNVNGSTQYQQSPCQSTETRKPPAINDLNAERQKQLIQDRGKPIGTKLQARPFASPEILEKERENPPSAQRASFNCDGRRYCSQMTSCAEAKYFLSNCPDVKMDGDRDGIPCEEQWCTTN